MRLTHVRIDTSKPVAKVDLNTASSGPSGQERAVTRDAFLTRLRRLVSIECELGLHPSEEDRRMIEQAMASTYWDCCRLGARQDARRILGLSDH
jgi:hypothetical protein